MIIQEKQITQPKKPIVCNDCIGLDGNDIFFKKTIETIDITIKIKYDGCRIFDFRWLFGKNNSK